MTRDEVIALWHDSNQDVHAFAAAIEARVLDKARISIGAMIRMGELPEPQHSERNGMVLAYNVIQSLKE